MASFNYMNNTAPFWDFVANLERQGNNHPIFGQDHHNRSTENEHGENSWGLPPHPANPWTWGSQLFGGPGGLPHRGPPGPPPPPGPHGPPPHHHDEGHEDHEKNDRDMDNDDNNDKGKENDNDNDNGEGPSGSGSDSEGGRHCGRHGRCGGRRGRHGFGGRGDFGGRGGFGPHHHGPHHHGRRGGHHGPPHHDRGSWGLHHRSHPYAGRGSEPNGPFDPLSFLNPLFAAFTAQHPSNNPTTTTTKDNSNEDFVPDADIFDTPSSYIIHLSLPGARKEDVGVNWDADKSELSIAGVIYRPSVDEELLKSLAVSERNVGPFERKLRLGSRANPARVDGEGITAKLEDGVLRVEVRKEEEGFVEVRKVDVE